MKSQSAPPVDRCPANWAARLPQRLFGRRLEAFRANDSLEDAEESKRLALRSPAESGRLSSQSAVGLAACVAAMSSLISKLFEPWQKT